MKRTTPLRAKKRINPVSKKRRKSRTGKLGIIRLAGSDMEQLRQQAYDRAQGLCEMERGGRRCSRYAGWLSGHLAHIGAKRRHGDHIDNVRWSCPECHGLEHLWGKSMEKPCAKKSRADL